MIVRIRHEIDEEEWKESIEILIDGSLVASFYDGELEDNCISRNFSDVHNIEDLMRRAYEAGKNGEDFIVKYGSEGI
jgi:hypothetical protein